MQDWRGFPQQERFVYSNSRFAFAGAGVRTGKTHAGARAFWRRVLIDYEGAPNADYEYWCIAPTFELTIVMKAMLFGDGVNPPVIPPEMVDTKRQGGDKQWLDLKRGGGTLCLHGGRVIKFKSADRPETLVSAKVRGVWWTEIARSKHAAWPNVRGRLSNYRDSWMIGDTSPMGRCWFWVELWNPTERGERPDTEIHHWTAEDSPFIPREEIEAAKRSLPPEFYRRDYEASWATFEGQIFSGFDRASHMVARCPFKPVSRYICADLNTTKDNPACWLELLVGPDIEKPMGGGQTWTVGQYHVSREYQEHFMLDYPAYAQALWKHYIAGIPATAIIVDPSMPNDFKNRLRGLGMNVMGGNNGLNAGIRMIGMHLHARNDAGSPCLTIANDCHTLAGQFEGWSWRRNSKGVVVDEPDKDALDPHHLDALRYGVMTATRSGASKLGYVHA